MQQLTFTEVWQRALFDALHDENQSLDEFESMLDKIHVEHGIHPEQQIAFILILRTKMAQADHEQEKKEDTSGTGSGK